MSNLTMIDFQIFPSQYEQTGDGRKCCWMGGRDPQKEGIVKLQPYETDAISGYTNPDWGFHLLATNEQDKYRLKYVKMSDPGGEWYGVTVDGKGKLTLTKWKEEKNQFIVKKLGAYYTLEFDNKHVECEGGYLGPTTDIQVWSITPPTQNEVKVYGDIPSGSFRMLWKFIKMDHLSGRDWVRNLAATSRKTDTLDRVFIPGTHDSGTEKNQAWYRTQYYTIPEQAAMGVRYFDLRVDKNWNIYHNTSSDITLKYVVDAVLDHLASHADEFFFLQITAEVPTGFSDRLFDYLKTNCPTVFPHVYLPDTIPTLENAKGKIFFIARYYAPAPHNDPAHPFKEHRMDWPDNTKDYANPSPFTGLKVYVQDKYEKVGLSEKFDDFIKPTLDKMFDRDSDWNINFTSLAIALRPLDAAKKINPWVANLLMWGTPPPAGALMVDEAQPGIIANIIAANF